MQGHPQPEIRVYVPVREQIENLAAKQSQESREIAPLKPSAQHTPHTHNQTTGCYDQAPAMSWDLAVS